MRYIGGKFRQSKKLSQHIKCVYDGETYIEPFCGSLSTIKYVKNFIKYGVFSDVQYQLIKMWTSLKKGWIPPQEISEQLYKEIKNKNDINNPLTAYVGYGLSFGGKYFGGYARPGIKNYSRKYDIQLYDSIML